MSGLKTAIVDYGLGNLYSVQRACEHVGMAAAITSDRREIEKAELVILPGVGAFGDAMQALRKLDLVAPLRERAAADRPMLGICLGLQLMMSESFEFGHHEGLGIFEGSVVRFDAPREEARALKVPEVCWNQVFKVEQAGDPWAGTPLQSMPNGTYQYFVHSYYVVPKHNDVIASQTQYGHIRFASSLRRKNVFACQFHPERSGPAGLKIYQTIAQRARLGA